MSQQQLLSLYISILVPIFSEWINDEDLCYLDCAVCSSHIRSNFMNTMEKCSISSINWDLRDVTESFKSWVLIRRLALKTIKISDKDTADDRKFLLSKNHYSNIQSDCCKDLYTILSKTNITADRVCISGLDWTAKQFLAVGHHITDIQIDGIDIPGDKLAKSCPNLRTVTLGDDESFETLLAIVDHCPLLESVENCSFERLIDSKDDRQSYACDLKRATVVDESAVCLGEGKYFNITSLYESLDYEPISEENCKLLSPLVKTLTSVDMFKNSPIIPIVCTTCHNLTELNIFHCLETQEDILSLITHSPKLKHFCLPTNNGELNPIPVDPFIRALALHCPDLESYFAENVIEDSNILTELFQKCSGLRDFHCFSLSLTSKSGFSCERYPPSLRVDYTESTAVIERILELVSGIQSVTIYPSPSAMPFYVKVLRLVPHLTSLFISTEFKRLADTFTLTDLHCDLAKLKLLDLVGCDIDSNVVTDICEHCPGLTKLYFSSNPRIKDSDVVMLLRSCAKLIHLDLLNCHLITSSIFSSVKSSGLRFLDVSGTLITKKQVNEARKTVSCKIEFC